MFCPNCGTQMTNDAKFCKECGWHRSEINNKKGINFNMPIISITSIIKGIIIILIIGIVVNFIIGRVNYKKSKDIYRTGIETTASGKIVYNKGNNIYAKNEIVKEGSDLYYFNSNEEMVKNDWVEYDGKWYYCESDGKIAKSKWVENTYYVDENGQMLKNTFTPDGYYVGDDGKYVDLNLNNINAQVNSNSLSEQIKNAKLLTEYSEDTLIDQIDTVKFGSYPQSDASGNVKEPIEWIVLDRQGDKALLLSKYILDCKCYNDFASAEVKWENSSIRTWLNNDFYNRAFSVIDKNAILLTTLKNRKGSETLSTTDDRIFLVDSSELPPRHENERRLATRGSNYARNVNNKGSKLQIIETSSWYNGNSMWWVRNCWIGIKTNLGGIKMENTQGLYIVASGNDVQSFYIDECNAGVRPALWVSY